MGLKALIITYYWPPAGGSGVQRWLYFVKYLREFGIEPVVFTVEHPSYPIEDKTLAKHIPEGVEVIRQKIMEPGRVVSNHRQAGSGFLPENPNLSQRFKNFIRANFFIPDAKMLWIRPSVRKLEKYLKKNPVDYIISTGPPHTTHLIAKGIKEKIGVKWLADFRDPWTEIDYFHRLPLTKSSRAKHHKLEGDVLMKADVVTVVTKTMKKQFQVLNQNCHIITNGYDDAVLTKVPEMDKPFTITHIGMLNADRNPLMFWEVIKELIEEDETFEAHVQINLVGQIADEIRNSIRSLELERFVNYTQYIPSDAVAAFQMKSQVLLLIVNEVPSAQTIVTGKVYEYLRAKRPILAIAPTNGDLAEIIDESQSGMVIDFGDRSGLKEAVKIYFEHYLKNQLVIDSVKTEKYHRKNLTAQLAELLKNH